MSTKLTPIELLRENFTNTIWDLKYWYDYCAFQEMLEKGEVEDETISQSDIIWMAPSLVHDLRFIEKKLNHFSFIPDSFIISSLNHEKLIPLRLFLKLQIKKHEALNGPVQMKEQNQDEPPVKKEKKRERKAKVKNEAKSESNVKHENEEETHGNPDPNQNPGLLEENAENPGRPGPFEAPSPFEKHPHVRIDSVLSQQTDIESQSTAVCTQPSQSLGFPAFSGSQNENSNSASNGLRGITSYFPAKANPSSFGTESNTEMAMEGAGNSEIQVKVNPDDEENASLLQKRGGMVKKPRKKRVKKGEIQQQKTLTFQEKKESA